MDITKYIAIGLVVGTVSGAIGIGGGVLMLPAMIWICGMKPAVAAGTSLVILVPPLVLPAALEYYRRGNVDLTAALFIAITFSFGAYAGAWLRHEHLLPEELLRLGLGLIMMYAAFNMIVISDSEATKAAGGIVATVFAWLAYLGLRLLGKRALARPQLIEQIQRMDQQGRGGPDYHI
ncbi:MAG TPA: sulfite exporter TauE/SafE family protein [Gemmataceae bacterium]|nr:sulfite exporter TauE/SafE family protein [Gemmataceae bacterium]